MTSHVANRAHPRAAPQEASGERPEASGAQRQRGGRVLAVLGGAIAVALCLALVNQLLVWRALQRLGESPLRLSYESAVSWVPGLIHVKRVVVKPSGTSWSATAERLRVELAVTGLLQGSLRIDELTATLVEWNDTSSGVTASGELRIAARGIASTQDAFQVDAAQLSLENWQLRPGKDVRAELHGELRLTTIRAPLGGGGLTLKAPKLQLGARLWRDGIRNVPLLVSGWLGVSEGKFDPRTRLTLTLEAPLEVPLRHWLLRISNGSVLKLASGTAELTVAGHSESLTLRSRALDRELLRLKDVRLEPLQFASLFDAGTEPLALQLSAVELALDTGTDLGRLTSPLRLEATVVRHYRPAWQITSATLELPRLHFAAPTPPEPPLRALVRLRHTDAAPGRAALIQGDIEMHGDRLGALYPLLGIRESVELMLSPFREQPFSASAGIESTATDVSLRELSVRTHTLQLQGFLHFTPSERRGALLVVTPAARLGLSLGNERRDVTLRPPVDWLERQRLAP